MSQTKIALPIRVSELRSETVDTQPVSDEYIPKETGDELYRFVDPEYRGTYGPFDPWVLRDQFLNWKLREWHSFFVMSGEFGTPYVTRNDFEEWQRLIRKAVLVPAHQWRGLTGEFDSRKVERLLAQLPILFDWDAEPATATLMGSTALDSMIASIQLDKLQGAEFRVCARSDCKSPPFRVGARHKIFCDTPCAHLVAVRADRKRKAELAAKKLGKGKERTER